MKTTFTASGNWVGRASVENVGGTLVLIYKHGGDHATNNGALHIVFSDDYGETWSDEDKTIAGASVTGFPMNPPDCAVGEDSGEPWLYVAPNGDLLLHMWKVNYGDTANGTYQSRSTDGGATWGTPALVDFVGLDAATDLLTFATDDHFVYNGVIYACARVYDDALPTSCKTIFIKSTDNGTSWDYVSDISSFTTSTIEAGIEYLDNSNILCLLRDKANASTYKSISSDMGATWSALTDISATFQVSGRHRIFTKTHLQGGANWWTDTTLVVCGFVLTSPGNSVPRRNAVWYSTDAGASWNGPYYTDDETQDAGYGDMAYDPSTDKYLFISYQGSLETADLVQYKFDWNI